jgi:hypothetical protein
LITYRKNAAERAAQRQRESPTRARSQYLEGLGNSEETARVIEIVEVTETVRVMRNSNPLQHGSFSLNPSLSSTNHCHTGILNVQFVRSKSLLNSPAWNRCLSTTGISLLTHSITA